jgi:hypothetical protein
VLYIQNSEKKKEILFIQSIKENPIPFPPRIIEGIGTARETPKK